MFLIITLCGSIYVRLVFSNFLILPFLIIFISNTNLPFWMAILQQKNTILFRMIFVSSVQFSSNRYVIGADEGTRTPTPLALVPKTSASTSSATSAYIIAINIIPHLLIYCQVFLRINYLQKIVLSLQ